MAKIVKPQPRYARAASATCAEVSALCVKVGIAMKGPMAGWDTACTHAELGILMRLLGPLSHWLDATRARCYKSAHSIPASWRDN